MTYTSVEEALARIDASRQAKHVIEVVRRDHLFEEVLRIKN